MEVLNMTSPAMKVFSGGKIPVVIGLMIVLLLGGLSGCALNTPKVDRTYVETIPDKESYLLSKLDERFENPNVHCELGRYYQSEGKWKKAEYHFKTALGFDPAHRKTQAAYVKMLVDEGQTDKADQTIQRYQRQLVDDPIQLVELAMVLADEKMDTYAISCFDKALLLNPSSFEANKQIGMFYLARDEDDKARDFLTKSFELNPNQAEVAGALGRLGVVVEVPVHYQAQTQEEQLQDSGT
jgi:tetratricopeptide (TPR) repeat protein